MLHATGDVFGERDQLGIHKAEKYKRQISAVNCCCKTQSLSRIDRD